MRRSAFSIDGFIADFHCHAAGLVIELDGGMHQDQAEYDTHRDRILAARGLHIVRLPNERVLTQLPTVLDEILATAHKRFPSPSP